MEPRDDGVWSPNAGRLYPVREGLLFLGYPRRDADIILSTMEEEHQWQGTAETVQRDEEFLRWSAPRAVDLINLASRFVEAGREPRALEVGAGSGWVSWLLAEAGYDTWLCDFEANSLAIGLMYEHEHLGEGRRFVTDARYLPFADETFDLVLMKEFVHHVADYERLFQEANRVLRPGGVLALMEPTRSVLRTLWEIRHPDPHEGHVITWLDAYLWSLRRNGMRVSYQTALFEPFKNRNPIRERLKARATASVAGLASPGPLAKAYIRLVGDAESLVIARKFSVAERPKRPTMAIVDPNSLVISADERAAFEPFRPILERVATSLDRVGQPIDPPSPS